MTRASGTPFGDLLRQLREQAGLTQAALAERAALTPNAISALERGERRQPYPHTLQALADALGLTPGQRALFFAARASARGGEPPAAPAPPTPAPRAGPAHNLPAQVSSFVGRATELADLADMLRAHRLVTLTGAGGSGKTRLALAAAAALLPRFPAGVWLVELAGLADPALVPEAVADALGLSESPGTALLAIIGAYLGPRTALLLLDNCEHLVEACAHLAERLLAACPGLSICATSRELLRVPGELTYLVPTLPVPDPGGPVSPAALAGYDAVRLFVERAATQLPGFQLNEANVAAVGAICRRLDGIPLALELAAARVRVMPPAQLVERLDNSLRFLTGGSRTVLPRQQTMRGTLDWSHNLLDAAQQRVLQRLSVFVGGWDIDAAEVVGATYDSQGDPVPEVLARLVEQSLVLAEQSGEDGRARYRMLEPVRQYALQRLEEGGEAAHIRRRHAALFLALVEQVAPELRRVARPAMLLRLAQEHDNIRAALAWALRDGEIEVAARIGWGLWPFWWVRTYLREGRRWMDQLRARGADLPPALRVRVLMGTLAMAYTQGDVAGAAPIIDELDALSKAMGCDPHAEAYLYAVRGLLAMGRGDLALAIAQLELSQPLLEQVGEAGMAAQNYTWIGIALSLMGDRAAAARRFELGLDAGRRIGGPVAVTIALFNLAQLALAAGDYALAAERLAEGVPICVEVGDQGNLVFFLEGLAVVAAATGDDARGARLFGAAGALLDRIGLRGHSYYQLDRDLHARTQAGLRARLGDAAWAAAWAAGWAMRLEQVVEDALSPQAPLL